MDGSSRTTTHVVKCRPGTPCTTRSSRVSTAAGLCPSRAYARTVACSCPIDGGGPHAATDDVADDEHEGVADLDHVVPVTADLGAARTGEVAGGGAVARPHGQGPGQQAALQRHGEVALEGVAAGVVEGQRRPAGQVEDVPEVVVAVRRVARDRQQAERATAGGERHDRPLPRSAERRCSNCSPSRAALAIASVAPLGSTCGRPVRRTRAGRAPRRGVDREAREEVGQGRAARRVAHSAGRRGTARPGRRRRGRARTRAMTGTSRSTSACMIPWGWKLSAKTADASDSTPQQAGRALGLLPRGALPLVAPRAVPRCCSSSARAARAPPRPPRRTAARRRGATAAGCPGWCRRGRRAALPGSPAAAGGRARRAAPGTPGARPARHR